MRRIHTATFVGYSYDASYYINNDASGYKIDGADYKRNADAVMNAIRSDYGPSARIVDCSDDTFFARPDYGSPLKGDCVEYMIVYNPIETIAEKREYSFSHSDGEQVTGAYLTLKRNLTFPAREKLLLWQERGLMYTRTGYGKKIPTTKQLFILGRWRRVYGDSFSNAGVCYVIIDGREVRVNSCNMEV